MKIDERFFGVILGYALRAFVHCSQSFSSMILLKILCPVGFFYLINVPMIQQGFCLTTEKPPICLSNSTVKGCGLIVEHGQPFTFKGRHGSVLINASLVGHQLKDRDVLKSCTWTFNMDGLAVIQPCTKDYWSDTSLQFVFETPGLKKVTVTVKFFNFESKQQVLSNCTFVNVTDCSRQLALEVSSAKGSFNISQNHTEVTLDSPGYINFTIIVFNIIDPFNFCHPFYYNWSLGDGQHLRNKEHVNHFYNHSGIFPVVLSIFDGRMFYKNISLTVCVKENPSPDNDIATAVDVSLILAICLAGFIMAVCLLLIFRKRRHILTEVARFDFRHEDFQSSNENIYCQYKQGCFRSLICRRGSDERLLVINECNSSRGSFGSTLPTEEL